MSRIHEVYKIILLLLGIQQVFSNSEANPYPLPQGNGSISQIFLNNLSQGVTKLQQQYETIIEEQQKTGLSLELIKKTLVESTLGNPIVDNRIHNQHLKCIKNCIPAVNGSCAEMENPSEGAFVFKIPNSDLVPFYAYCRKLTGNSVWTVIQRREEGIVDFNRNWHDYRDGFGDVYGDYWIGLERLHVLTKARDYELKIYLEDFEDDECYAKYTNFSIAGEDEGYKLTVGGYKGTCKDSFSVHSGLKFTTYDRKNDKSLINCAQKYKGGWWFESCFWSNLNGRHYSLSDRKMKGGIQWMEWNENSLQRAIMMIRPL